MGNEKQIFEVRYVDDLFRKFTEKGQPAVFDVNLAKGKPVLIEAKSIGEALEVATQRIRKKVAYSVGSVVRVA